MAKLATLFLILIAMQGVLLLYPGSTAETTDLWTFVTNVQNWNNLNFILGFIGIAGAMGLIGVIAGSAFGFKTDFIVFAGAISGLIGMGTIFVNLSNFLANELIGRFLPNCIDGLTGSICSQANYITGLIIGPIAFYYVWSVIEWWRGKDM